MKFPTQRPAVIGSIITPAGLAFLQHAELPCDAIEVRVDSLLERGARLEEIKTALRTRLHPVLLTLRIPAEGGQREWKNPERHAAYTQLLPDVEAIDVELATCDELKDVISMAQDAGKTIVLSAHALGNAASAKQFEEWTSAEMARDPGWILKIASHIGSWRDLQRLAAPLVNHPEREIAVMGLGPHAAQSRLVLAALGSRLVYGWLDEPAAPGQPSAAEMRKMVATLPAAGE